MAGARVGRVLTIATWNVNSIKARLPHLLAWLRATSPDVVLLQETKVVDAGFPLLEIGDAGYNAAIVGQKTYNGVAVLSRQPIDVLAVRLPGDGEDGQARFLDVFTAGVRAVCLYAPNGNPADSGKFAYKLAWLERLYAHAQGLLASGESFVLGGDWNVTPSDDDVYDPFGWRGDALCRPESRAAWRKIVYLGLTDAVGCLHPGAGHYTWWDYRAGAFAADHGLRIDHLLLSPTAADRLDGAGIDREPRGWERASDHTPVWCRLRAD
ncbi:MAG: exodeoxyribonuclease III [Rhodospirillales bacterium]|nr:exodeoxyribonuclease III [Rhodospirillales bacterium]